MEDMFRFADKLGPFKIIHIYEPSIGLKAVLVVDNVARGPALGGVRIAPDVSTEECFRLARAMTLKNAAADLPYGGGKIVVYGDPKCLGKRKASYFGLLPVRFDILRNISLPLTWERTRCAWHV